MRQTETQLSVNMPSQYRSLSSTLSLLLKIINVKQLNGSNKYSLDPDMSEIYKHASYQPIRLIIWNI